MEIGTAGVVKFAPREPEEILRRYCLGSTDVDLDPWPEALGRVPVTSGRYTGAYLFYDPMQSTDGFLHTTQIVAANGLNAGISATKRATAAGVIDFVNEQLQAIPEATGLEDVALYSGGPIDTAMELAYYALTAVPGVNMTRASKIMHLVRPSLYPVLDNLTKDFLKPKKRRWGQVQTDLIENAGEFAQLEQFVVEEIVPAHPDAVPLGRLRIHDILLWWHADGRRTPAGE